MKSFRSSFLAVAAVFFSSQMLSEGAVTVTASKNYVDMKTKVDTVTNAEVGVVGYTIGTNTNCVLVSTNYVDTKIGKIKTDRITDGTNTIDAARGVWQSYSGRVCTNADEAWTYVVGGATYTAEQMTDALGNGNSQHSQALVWMNSVFEGKDGEEEFEGWFVIDGSGSPPVGYSYTTGDIPESSADPYLALAEYGGFDYVGGSNVTITAFRGTEVSWTNYVGRLALTNDIPPAITVVAPSTNATAGTAADAKATGTALYTGFTEWEFSGYSDGVVIENLYYNSEQSMWLLAVSYEGRIYSPDTEGNGNETNLSFIGFYKEPYDVITATRHLVTPTKTSQLVNDGSNGVPFAVISQIPAPVDISGKLDGEAAYPAWKPNIGYEGDGTIVSYAGRLWENYATTGFGDKPTEHPESFRLKTLNELKQDALTPEQTNAVNSGVTYAKVQTWDGYAELISAKVSTNALEGQTFDFSRNYDIIRATAAIAEALGATVTNNPTAQGGN